MGWWTGWTEWGGWIASSSRESPSPRSLLEVGVEGKGEGEKEEEGGEEEEGGAETGEKVEGETRRPCLPR